MLRSMTLPTTLWLVLGAFLAGASPEPSGDPSLLETPLRTQMEGLKDNLKGLAIGLQAGDDAAVLGHVAEMQRWVLLAKLASPPNLAEVPEEQRDAHSVHFRRDLAVLLQELAALEVEVLDGEPERAFARVKGSLFRMREEAHGRYQPSK